MGMIDWLNQLEESRNYTVSVLKLDIADKMSSIVGKSVESQMLLYAITEIAYYYSCGDHYMYICICTAQLSYKVTSTRERLRETRVNLASAHKSTRHSRAHKDC